MNYVKLISNAIESEDYRKGMIDMLDYLHQDGVGLKSAESLVTGIEEAKANQKGEENE